MRSTNTGKKENFIEKSDVHESLQEMVLNSKTNGFLLSRPKLKEYLIHFGEFPEKYRSIIWRFLLQLPENRNTFDILLEKPLHPSLKNFRHKYPIKSERISRTMEKVISCLIYWSPIFEGLEYLPRLIFPFIVTFKNDTFTSFEVILTFIINWAQKWFDFYPNPPIEVLDASEDLLSLHDKVLYDHFVKCGISTQVSILYLRRFMFGN